MSSTKVQNLANISPAELNQLVRHIKQWGRELGFAQVGITDTDLQQEEAKLQDWLDKGYHGEMGYMANHGMMRARPHELHQGTKRVISVRMDYLPPSAGFAMNLSDPNLAYISRYAGGRDYHKLMRQRIKKLGDKIEVYCQEQGFGATDSRPFVDSAPVMERPLAEKAGLGWTGKHSLILNHSAGSWFFLGELFINLPLPIDIPISDGCNTCVACIKSCPTGAIVEPYVVDGRRCISYLTIELQGPIPEEFRPLMGNRIYGCDDCQLVCPINAQAPLTQEHDFHIRQQIMQPELLTLFNWSEKTFLSLTEGSAIRRIGHKRWLRNIAIALGNAPANPDIIEALCARKSSNEVDDMVLEHIDWALSQQQVKVQQQVNAQQQAENQQTVQLEPVKETLAQRKTARVVRSIKKGLPRDA